jgi:putative transposase
MEKQSFDFEAFKKQAATRIKNGETLLGKEGVLTLLLKEFLESIDSKVINFPMR